MKSLLTILLFVLVTTCAAIEIDSVKRQEIILEGQREFCALLEANQKTTSAEKKHFVVVVDGEPAPTYIAETHVNTPNTPILSQVCIDSLNAKLRRTFRDYNVEMYVLIIKTFNIIIKTELPVNVTGQQLFQNFLYDEQTNLRDLRIQHTSITNEIIYNTFSAREKDCIVYSRAEYTGTIVTGKIRTWTYSKRICHHAFQPTYPKLEELNQTFGNRIVDNPQVTQSGTEYSLQVVADEFNKAAKYMHLKSLILNIYTPGPLSEIFGLFNGAVDYESLTVQERIHSLGVYAGYPMHHNLITKEEVFAVDIIRTTPPSQAPDLLAQLSLASPLATNPNYNGDKESKALIVCLIEEIDDAVVGEDGNNYAGLMRALTQVTLSNQTYVNQHLPTSDQDWVNRTIYWDDAYVLTAPPVGTHNYIIDLQNNAQIEVKKTVIKKLDPNPDPESYLAYVPVIDNSYPEQTLSPFDIVVIYNRSSLGMIQVAGAAQDQPYLGPAIMLKYCDDKEFNQQAITGTAIILSTVAVLTGPGAVLAAVEAGNVALAIFEGVQFVGAYMDLVANAGAPQEFKDAVATFNVIVGVWGVSRIAVSAGQYTADILSGVKSGDISPVPLSTAETYCSQFDQIVTWDNISPETKEYLRRMREQLGKQVDANALLNFVAHSAEELRVHLQSIPAPEGIVYTGNLYKSLGKNAEIQYGAQPDFISPYSIEEAWGRYDTPGESAMYFSETLAGNEAELSYYGNWSSFSTYEYQGAQVSNVLDLTNENTRKILGVEYITLVRGMSDKSIAYEFTNVLGTWARTKGYKGLIVPGARGSTPYRNIVIFEQADVTSTLSPCTRIQIK